MTTLLEMEVDEIMKGGFDHYMLKEIHEQPESLLQSMRGRLMPADRIQAESAGCPLPNDLTVSVGFSGSRMRMDDLPAISGPSPDDLVRLGGLYDWREAISRGRRIIFIACGTSFHACVACRQLFEELTGLPVSMELASDLQDRLSPIFRDDVCVFVSQSGETADTLGALAFARAKGAVCVGVTNTVGSAIARDTVCGVHINAGAEIGVASTKAYTSQIVCITMLALMLAGDSRRRRPALRGIVQALHDLPGKVREALALDAIMRDVAERLQDAKSILIFGRGQNYATALEAALKIKECCYVHSEGLLAGEMKHGPLALVDEALPLIVICTRDRTHGKMMQVLQQLHARGASLIVLCNEGDDEAVQSAGPGAKIVAVPHTVDCLQPVVNVVPLQLLAYHLAVRRGHDVDRPRNLAKSVTTTEL